MTAYKLPWRSILAHKLGALVPRRVRAWFWLDALDNLELHLRDVDHYEFDDEDRLVSREIFSAVSAVRLENIKRYITEQHLGGRIEGKSLTRPPGGIKP